MYLNIKSKYIKDRIRGLEWSKHAYVDCLIKLEHFIINSPKTFMGNIYFSALRTKYHKEFIEVLKELRPREYLLYLEETKSSKEKQLKQMELNRKKEDELKVEWQKAGGRI